MPDGRPSSSDYRLGSDEENVWFSLHGARRVMSVMEARALALAILDEASVVYVCAACHYPHGDLSPAGLGRKCPGCGRRHYATGSGETRGAATAKHVAWKERRERAEKERTEAFRAVFP